MTMTVLLTGAWLLAGCGGTSVLRIGDPPQGLSAKAPQIESKITVPCLVKLICPDRMTGQKDELITEFGSTTYDYILRSILEKAIHDSLYKAFDAPRGKVLEAFTFEVEVYQSRLLVRGSNADYFIKVQALLRSPEGKAIVQEDVEHGSRSPFDGSQLPPAVWEGVYGVATKAVEKVATDPRTSIAAQKYMK
jgi:hypothetical protein